MKIDLVGKKLTYMQDFAFNSRCQCDDP